MTWMIVRFDRRHLDDVYRLDKRVFKKRAFSKSFFMKCYRYFPELFLVAIVNGKVVGDVITVVDGEYAEILSLVVDENHRKRGIGSALVKSTITKLRKMNVKIVYLHVDSSSNAVSFYKKMGFNIESFVPGYYEDGDAYLMAMNLSKWSQ